MGLHSDNANKKVSLRSIGELDIFDFEDIPVINGISTIPDGLANILGDINSLTKTVHISPNSQLVQKANSKTWTHTGPLAFSHLGESGSDAQLENIRMALSANNSEVVRSSAGRIRLTGLRTSQTGTGGQEKLGEFNGNTQVVIDNILSTGFGTGWIVTNSGLIVYSSVSTISKASATGTHLTIHGSLGGGTINNSGIVTQTGQAALYISPTLTKLQILANTHTGAGPGFKPTVGGNVASFVDSKGVNRNITTISSNYGFPLYINNVDNNFPIGASVHHSGFGNTPNNGDFIVEAFGHTAFNYFTLFGTNSSGDTGIAVLNQTTVNCTAAHGLPIGTKQQVDIGTTLSYAGTHVATITSTTAFTIPVVFSSTDLISTWSHGSTNSTNIKIDARANNGIENSMITAEVHFVNIASPFTVAITASITPVAISPTTYTAQKLERFTADTSGKLTYTGTETLDLQLNYRGLMEKAGGGPGIDIGLGYLVDDAEPAGLTYPRTVNSGVIQISDTQTVKNVTTGTTFQLSGRNFGNTDNITVSQADLTITRAP